MPIAKANNMDIWYETFGNKEDEPLLLIMGACCQGILWPTEFCQQLAAAGFFVIRYDHRDSGHSTCFDFEKKPYDLNDMVQDAIGLLDFLAIKRFHIVGLSLGAVMGELIAVRYASRTLSLTLIATSSDFRPMNLAFAGFPQEENALSPPTTLYLAWMNKFLQALPKNEMELLEMRVEGWQILNGNKAPFEHKRYRELHRIFLQRASNLSVLANHIQVCKISEELIRRLPAQVSVPTLILHGSEDPIFPPDHGRALASKIQQAKFIAVEGMGHVPNIQFYEIMISNIKSFSRQTVLEA